MGISAFLLGGGILALDQGLKMRAEKHPGEFKEVVFNRGFAGGKLSDRPDLVRNAALLSNALSLFMFLTQEDKSRLGKLKKAGLCALSMGGLSNTIDRVRKQYVVDYIPKGRYVYNIGDFSVAAGAVIIFLTAVAETVKKDGRE